MLKLCPIFHHLVQLTKAVGVVEDFITPPDKSLAKILHIVIHSKTIISKYEKMLTQSFTTSSQASTSAMTPSGVEMHMMPYTSAAAMTIFGNLLML